MVLNVLYIIYEFVFFQIFKLFEGLGLEISTYRGTFPNVNMCANHVIDLSNVSIKHDRFNFYMFHLYSDVRE